MDDDLTTLEQVLRDRGAEVPHLQQAPARMLVRARRRVLRNAVASAVAAGLVIVGASAGLAGLRASSSGLGAERRRSRRSRCTAGDLQATANLDGAAGSLGGSIDVTNHGDRTCTLEGYPSVTLTDPSGSLLSLEVQRRCAMAGGPGSASDRMAGRHPPPGVRRLDTDRPVERLSPARRPATVDDRPHERDGGRSRSPAPTSLPTCNGAAEPSTLDVGPFEPGGER